MTSPGFTPEYSILSGSYSLLLVLGPVVSHMTFKPIDFLHLSFSFPYFFTKSFPQILNYLLHYILIKPQYK
jgi:hypothetical protein